MSLPGASIIVAFYNNLQFLRLVLAGFSRQSVTGFELIIADDGSKSDVVEEIGKIQNSYPFPVRHVWHQDKGWRKNAILNNAVKESLSDYLVFIDADCIPHRHFIKEHLKHREKLKILSGRRVNLSEKVTLSLTDEMVRNGYLESNNLSWIIESYKGNFSHVEKGLYLPLFSFYLTKKNRGLLGCNFSIHKEDLYAINGFDERYEAPTIGEDTDIEYRSKLAGIGIKSVRNLAIQYHLYHPRLDRENNNKNIFEEIKAKGIIKTPHGLIKN